MDHVLISSENHTAECHIYIPLREVRGNPRLTNLKRGRHFLDDSGDVGAAV